MPALQNCIETNVIRIRGARTHNLRNVSLDLPTEKLIVVTGVSGSGKSSLAFDTLFAEGQRRYLESVSVHTRSLIRQMRRPDVDEITGLPPTVSVDQRVRTVPARSTLAVTTEIHDYLRLLYTRSGQAHCPQCGRDVDSQTVEQIVTRVFQLPERTRFLVLSPMVRSRKGGHRDVLERIARFGFVRVRIDGQLHDLANVGALKASQPHTIEAVVDRLVVRDGSEQRLRESVDLACRESDGTCIISHETEGDWTDQLFSTRFCCPDCDLSFATPEPRLLSFTSAFGACSQCEGYGVQGVAEDIDDTTVFRRTPCSACHGTRLQPFASRIDFLGMTITQFTSLTVDDALQQLQSWNSMSGVATLSESRRHVADRVIPDISRRLQCLAQVGLGYLQLDRVTRTLSGGEFQRARLATCLGSALHGACYVLDEPTSGLHARDTQRLLETLRSIRDAGGTLIVVEHDGDVMRAADWLIDLGPGAGINGGQLMFAGRPDDVPQNDDSPTAVFLNSGTDIKSAPRRRTQSGDLFADARREENCVFVRNARLNCLQTLTVRIPLQQLVCVTGVSGSGKSSLIMDTLLPVVTAACSKGRSVEAALLDVDCDQIENLELLHRVVSTTSAGFVRNRRSSIATICGVWNVVRKLFAGTREARAQGFSSTRFSFNSGDGRCSECRGTGQRDLKMAFLPDATVPCPECLGKRFNAATLRVRFKGQTVADVLNLRIEQAIEFFADIDAVHRVLSTFMDVGLGYVTLGQPAATFSGGEAQRVRLATELCSPRREHTLFVMDEPTRGLHAADVAHLLKVLRGLVDAQHSVVVIEHNLDVVAASEWIIDIGPDCGPEGGCLVFEGTPDQLASADGCTAVAMAARR
jgi:excinuclease ABC subunit A